MTLKEWLKSEGRTLLWFAEHGGTRISYQRLSGICSGRIEPRLPEISKILDATGGKVDCDGHLEAAKQFGKKARGE
jgi:hypothetical protein